MAFLKLDCYQRPNYIHGLPSTSRLLGRPGNIQRLNSVIRRLLRPFPNTQSEMCTKYNTCHHQRLPPCRHSSFQKDRPPVSWPVGTFSIRKRRGRKKGGQKTCCCFNDPPPPLECECPSASSEQLLYFCPRLFRQKHHCESPLPFRKREKAMFCSALYFHSE